MRTRSRARRRRRRLFAKKIRPAAELICSAPGGRAAHFESDVNREGGEERGVLGTLAINLAAMPAISVARMININAGRE